MAEGDKDRVPVAREGGSGFFSSSAAAALRLWPRGRVAAWRAAVGPGVHLICPATGCLLYDSQLSLSALSALCRRPSLLLLSPRLSQPAWPGLAFPFIELLRSAGLLLLLLGGVAGQGTRVAKALGSSPRPSPPSAAAATPNLTGLAFPAAQHDGN
ncbi:hypothetical protein MPTK1_5g02720 [Marchantia polymorpha subsp. ruderalis]|uniref:Uncharacterized protein n=2 Tax=Marchantia polymorpha TaxID=3197 RepID=A0AAF6BEA1_MARPO|nr:hypothetical protein MARPO_0124s0051 [Marchantia polymorpha]BBN10335.1 hypothetical protein Mp_5g02720 [Marchantia polymorpha subsp. ruderalis]|eukprot:PTQ30483.1 hypothetical protein MARPO_0124s0051 [Marchantia polymorpha]